MATITNPVNKQNIVDRFSDYVVATANSGIAWGTNAYPFAECDFYGNFGGGTVGRTMGINGDSIPVTTNSEISAQNIYDTLITETYQYTAIRNITAQLFVSGAGGNTGSRPTAGTVYDTTAVAFMNTTYRQSISSGRDNVYADNTITSAGLEAMFDSMRTNYSTSRDVNGGTFVTTVCHASCHSSCHSSRGRR